MGDFYNMSSAISNGELRTSAGEQANLATRLANATAIKNAKDSVKADKELGIMGGVKDAITDGSQLASVGQKVDAYKAAIKAPSGIGGFNEVAVTQDDFKGKPALAGDEVLDAAEKPSAAITTSEGTLDEGSDIINKGGKFANAIGDTESIGSKVAGATLKGVGVAGSLASAGLDIAQDVKSLESGHGIAGDNWEEKIANIGTIGGAALDMAGFIPGFQILGVIGTGISAASGVLDAAGEAVSTAKSIGQDKTPPPQGQITGQQTLAGQTVSQRVN
jgi:hypothetical protein